MFGLRKLSLVFALILVFVLGSVALAQTATPGAMTPSVTVTDQAIQNGTVTVQTVVAALPGFIVIHNDANGKPGADIGHAAVQTGENSNVQVTIDTAQATPKLYAMLHVDAGTAGTYEFPGADVPVQVNGQVVNVGFNVTGLPQAASTGTPAAGATTGAAAAQATTAATATTAAAATTAPTAAAAAAGAATSAAPRTAPVTGGDTITWLLPVLALVVLFLVAGLGLNLARRAR